MFSFHVAVYLAIVFAWSIPYLSQEDCMLLYWIPCVIPVTSKNATNTSELPFKPVPKKYSAWPQQSSSSLHSFSPFIKLSAGEKSLRKVFRIHFLRKKKAYALTGYVCAGTVPGKNAKNANKLKICLLGVALLDRAGSRTPVRVGQELIQIAASADTISK